MRGLGRASSSGPPSVSVSAWAWVSHSGPGDGATTALRGTAAKSTSTTLHGGGTGSIAANMFILIRSGGTQRGASRNVMNYGSVASANVNRRVTVMNALKNTETNTGTETIIDGIVANMLIAAMT